VEDASVCVLAVSALPFGFREESAAKPAVAWPKNVLRLTALMDFSRGAIRSRFKVDVTASAQQKLDFVTSSEMPG